MTEVQKCAICDRPTDATICWPHTHELERAIAELPAAIRELHIAVIRQARVDNPIRAGRTQPEDEQADVEQARVPAPLRSRHGRITLPSTALPFEPAAAVLHDQAVAAVHEWTDHLAAARALRLDAEPTTIARCIWLIAHLRDARQLDNAADMHQRFRDLARRIRGAIDRHRPDMFAGRCDAQIITVSRDDLTLLTPQVEQCGADLYANADDRVVECQECGAVYDLRQRREQLIEMSLDQLGTATQIANALTDLDKPITPSSIRQMAHRQEIISRGRDPHDDKSALYRVGDVVDVLDRREERKRELEARRQKRRAAS